MLAPEPPAGYVRRASLLHHLEGLLERRLTVLRAPAGFGKTTVLADVVRDVKAQGLVAGWIPGRLLPRAVRVRVFEKLGSKANRRGFR